MKVSHDRSDIIYFVGKQHASPALKGSGEPVLLKEKAEGDVKRVGWPAFFAALDTKQLDLAFDSESGEHKFIARGSKP